MEILEGVNGVHAVFSAWHTGTRTKATHNQANILPGTCGGRRPLLEDNMIFYFNGCF
jgi:hypothetical protein